MLAVIYDRGSTLGQAENYSRVDAEKEGIRIAESNGFKWEYHKEIKSGASLARREVLLGILDRVANGEVQAIIVQDLDRLGRPDEAADFETIKNICYEANCKVYTQSTVYDWSNPDDVMLGRFKSAIAGREREYITERSIRGKKAKASEGGFLGGQAALGYKVCYKLDERGKRLSWLEIDESERLTVTLIFELYIKHGASGCARRLNKLGHKGKRGSNFGHRTIFDVIRNPIYAGYIAWGYRGLNSKFTREYDVQWVYKPELQIVPLDVWEKAQEVKKQRSKPHKNDGSWGKSPFTGFLCCEACGRSMVIRSANQSNGTKTKFYQCNQVAVGGKAACPDSKTKTFGLVAQGVIPFVVELIAQNLNIEQMIQTAVNQYGFTVTEDELKRQLEAELHTTKQRRQRLIDSISEGVISKGEAKSTMQDLRYKIGRIERELDNLGGKVKAREDYIKAMKSLKGVDLESFLWEMLEKDVAIFRQFLGLIFEPNSIRVKTYRIKGRKFGCDVIGYQLTEGFKDLQSMSGVLTLPQDCRLLVDLSQLLVSA